MAEYTIYLNSADAIRGATIADKTYGFNWTGLEDGAYDLTFSFRSIQNTGPNAVGLISLPDIGTVEGGAATGNTGAQSSNIIGILRPVYHGLVSGASGNNREYSLALRTDNPPVRVQKPVNNEFRVVISNINGSVLDGTLPASYAMIIHLKKVEI